MWPKLHYYVCLYLYIIDFVREYYSLLRLIFCSVTAPSRLLEVQCEKGWVSTSNGFLNYQQINKYINK